MCSHLEHTLIIRKGLMKKESHFWRNISPRQYPDLFKFLSFHSAKPFFMQNISAFLSAWQIVAWGVSCWIFCVLPRHIKNFLFLHELNFRLTFSLGFKDRVGPWSIYKRWRVRFFKGYGQKKKDLTFVQIIFEILFFSWWWSWTIILRKYLFQKNSSRI